MSYSLKLNKRVDKVFKKLAKKNKKQHLKLLKKIKEVLKNPHAFKPLKKPMAGQHRVHVGSFVLTYSIDEKNKVVKILDYAHHDEVYKK